MASRLMHCRMNRLWEPRLVIETGELLVRRTDDDLVARLKRYGTQGYAGAAGQGSLRGVKVFPCFSL